MATIGQIVFYSMVILIVVFSTLIILILAVAFSKQGPEVLSISTKPTANLGQDQLLSCYLATETQQNRLSEVTWEKKELQVYKYENGAPALEGQAPAFKGRVQLFPDAVTTGNASLLLRGVRRSDEGEYTCTIKSSAGQGKINIQLRVAAFSAPTFRLSDDVLIAEAVRWFPRPTVTWTNQAGEVLDANTSLTESSSGIFSVVSWLQPAGDHSLKMENDLVMALSNTIITGTAVSSRTFFTFSAAPSPFASVHLNVMIGLLCAHYVT